MTTQPFSETVTGISPPGSYTIKLKCITRTSRHARACRGAGTSVRGEACHHLHRLGLLGRDRQAGDAGVGPSAVALADARDRAHQRHLVANSSGTAATASSFRFAR